MRVLIATKETQGQRANDFSWTDEGELVMFPFECDGESVDGRCGCRRSMVGFVTNTGTTTFKVADLPGHNRGTYTGLYIASMREAGWFPKDHPLSQENVVRVTGEIEELLSIASRYPIGSILEKRGSVVQERNAGGRREKKT